MSTTPLRSDDTLERSTAVFDAMLAHSSCRHYSGEPVADVDLDRMIRGAQRAATSSNLQMWSAIVVRDPGRRRELAHLCGDQKHIADAPVFIAWCADRSRVDAAAESCGYRQNVSTVESFLVAAVDTAIAMQNAVLVAESSGYGTCYIGGIRNDGRAVCDLLGLPDHVVPIAGMTLGRPAPSERSAEKPRLPLEAVVHYERYQPVSESVLAEYDAAMRKTGIYIGRQQDGVRADGSPALEIAEEEYGWCEHSSRRASRPSRPGLTRVIRDQGFDLE